MDAIIAVLTRYGYWVIFGTVFAEQIGLPIPAIPVLLAAGALVGTGHLSAALALALAGAASLAADTVWYAIGRRRGARVLGLLCRVSLEPDSCVSRTQRIFTRHGARSLLVAKFIPGFSTIAPPLSGVVRIPIRQFLVFTGLGGVLWAGAFLAVGWLFSRQLEIIAESAARFGSWTVALLGAMLGGYIAWKYIERQRFLRKLRIARITPEELKLMLEGGEDVMVVDVRDQIDFDVDPAVIPGALHVTTDELECASPRDPPRPRDHPLLYVTERSVQRPGGAALETARHQAGAAAGWRLSRLARTGLSADRCARVGDTHRRLVMIWGLTASTFTLMHVLLSLIGIGAGLVVMAGLLTGRSLNGWTGLFLFTTVATSVTGFGFPFDRLLPSHKVGIISLVVLVVAILARYALHLRGPWRWIYVVCAMVALYLNVFVGVVQAFLRIPLLHAMAPQQTESPFVVVQLVGLALFGLLTIVAATRFRPSDRDGGAGSSHGEVHGQA